MLLGKRGSSELCFVCLFEWCRNREVDIRIAAEGGWKVIFRVDDFVILSELVRK